MASMRRFSIAILLALYVGVVPFALGGQPLAALSAVLGLAAILLLIRRLAGQPMPRR